MVSDLLFMEFLSLYFIECGIKELYLTGVLDNLNLILELLIFTPVL